MPKAENQRNGKHVNDQGPHLTLFFPTLAMKCVYQTKVKEEEATLNLLSFYKLHFCHQQGLNLEIKCSFRKNKEVSVSCPESVVYSVSFPFGWDLLEFPRLPVHPVRMDGESEREKKKKER